MSILNIIKKSKIKIIEMSLDNDLSTKNKISLLNLPLFSLSMFITGISLAATIGLSLFLGENSIFLMSINALMLSYFGFNYAVYKKGAKKTIKDINEKNYEEILRNIDFFSLTTGLIEISPEKNNEFVNLLTSIYNSDFEKDKTEEIFKDIRENIKKEDLYYVLNDPELLMIQRNNNISSGLYIYSLLIKLEEFLLLGDRNNLEKRDFSTLTIEDKYQQGYICGEQNNFNEDVSVKIKSEMKESSIAKELI